LTDASGRFRLGPVEPVYRSQTDLFIEHQGYALQALPGDGISIFPGRDADLGTFRLAPGRVFTGRVLDTDGSPTASAAVEASLYRCPERVEDP
jgi:hypothetical protein